MREGPSCRLEGAEVVRLTTITGVVLFDDETARVGAAYFMTQGQYPPQLLWQEAVEGAPGPAALDQAVQDLGQGLLDNLQTAVERFLDAIKAL